MAESNEENKGERCEQYCCFQCNTCELGHTLMISRVSLNETVMCDRKHYDLFYDISYEEQRFVDRNGKAYISFKEDEETGRFIESSRKLKVNLPEFGVQELSLRGGLIEAVGGGRTGQGGFEEEGKVAVFRQVWESGSRKPIPEFPVCRRVGHEEHKR